MPNRIKGRNRDARLRVLMLETSPETAALVASELERAGVQVRWVRVDAEGAFIGSLRSLAPDLILATPSLPGFDVPAALRVVQALRPTAPLHSRAAGRAWGPPTPSAPIATWAPGAARGRDWSSSG